MRVARRTFLTSALSSLAAPSVMRLSRADAPPITLKLHHFFSAVSSGHDKFLVPWARQIEAGSGGRLRIDIFPSMQLGGAPAALFDQVRGGDADIVWAMPSLTPGRFPKIETFELPFVPSRRALVSSKALQDFAAVYLNDEFSDVHPLCFSCSDRGVVHAGSAVRTVEDIKDMKLHVQTRLAGEAMRALGAVPVPMPMEQLPMAITAGVVNGCVDPWHAVPPLRLNDLLKTHTEFSDGSLSSTTFVLAMNKDVYDQLPRDLKPLIDRNSEQLAAGMAGAMWDIQAAVVANDVGERGDVIVTLLPEAVAHWRKAIEPVVEAWLKDMKKQKTDGDKMLASVHALLAKYANEPEPPQPQNPPLADRDAQPDIRPASKLDTTPPPKVDSSAAQPPAAASPTPIAKPVPPPPHVATQAATPAPAASITTPAPVAAPSAPVAPPAKPILAPAPSVAAGPTAPAVASPVVPAPPAPPVPAPPKTLNIPL